ncbi:hypothetical protein [Botrimarina mediterranea]|uniref:Uncharacterized protein n=1 Tax=Botrimarina mediterranea TaxID=2528022 RepID=A0A518K8S2_9BACT|nr:hypothetical protein [Botrimarina mediterranea]QDV74194.1 hypothetical protein Spa11_23940 [Botrimarina mediterranea]QDV78825.1 hypothetical protein K2D_24330 [Planctomycetes bacterium K2D]
MKKLVMLVGALAIATIAFAPFAYINGALGLDAYKTLALVMTAVWFVAALWPGAEASMEEAIDE